MSRTKIAAWLVALALGLPAVASAQTPPNWTYGYVPTTAQWNQLFASKQDYLGAPPLLITGGTLTGSLVTTPPLAGGSGFNLPPGTTPTSPNNGDLWSTSSGLFVQINGVTIGPLSGATSSSFGNTSPITLSFPSGVVTYACPTCGITGSPLSQFASTTSAQLAGIISDETGTTALVFANGPTLIAPILGAATATSINKVAITAPAASATLTIANGKTLTANNSITLAGTDATTMSFPTTSATIARTDAGQTFTGTNNFGIVNSGVLAVTATNAAAFAVGQNGATNPAFVVNDSTALQVAGLSVTGAVTGGAVALAAIDSGSNTNLTISAKGSGTIQIGSGSTGTVTITPASVHTGNAAFGGSITAASLSTPGTIGGSICSSSGGLFYYVAGINCFTSGAATSLAPGTTTISPSTSGSILWNNSGVLQQGMISNYMGGLTLSNDSGSPNTVLDIAAGSSMDSTNASLITIGAFTKSTAGAWASGSGSNGMGNGLTIAANTWYHVCLTPNGGTPDIWFDTSATCANKPTGVSGSLFRRIGDFKTASGTSNILAFIQRLRSFYWAQPVQDQTSTALTAGTATSLTLASIPLGVRVRPIIGLNPTNSGATTRVRIYSPDLPDNNLNNDAVVGVSGTGILSATAYAETQNSYSNTLQQIRAWSVDSGTSLSIFTNGWVDDLGQ